MFEAYPDRIHEFPPTIVDDTYDTIFAPDKWPEIFEDLGSRTRCASFLFGRVDYLGDVRTFAKNNFDDDRLNLLVEHHATLETNPVIALFDQCDIGSLFRLSDHFSACAWEKLDVGHDVFIPQSLHFSLCATVAKGSRHIAPLSILRSKRQGDFADQELALFQSLTTHMARARFAPMKRSPNFASSGTDSRTCWTYSAAALPFSMPRAMSCSSTRRHALWSIARTGSPSNSGS